LVIAKVQYNNAKLAPPDTVAG